MEDAASLSLLPGSSRNNTNDTLHLLSGGLLPNYTVQNVTSKAIIYPRGATIFAAICACVFVVFGILGNFLTILALWRCVKLRNATTAFVISLCTADLLFCIFNLPLTASRYIHEAWLLGDTMCTLFPFFFYGNVAVSLLSMTSITINRYILINHYRIYDKVYTKPYIATMIAFCWLFSFSMLLPTLARKWGQFGYHPETFSCTILKKNGKSPKKFLFIFGLLLPCIVIIISYSCIFYKVHRSRKNIAAHTPKGRKPSSSQLSQRGDEMRLTRLMLIVFCSFLLCFLPLMIVNVFDNKFKYPAIHVLASILAWMSSCINPIIYAYLNRQYRQAYIRLLCPRERSSSSTTSPSGSGSAQSRTLVSDVFIYHPAANKLEKKQVEEKI